MGRELEEMQQGLQVSVRVGRGVVPDPDQVICIGSRAYHQQPQLHIYIYICIYTETMAQVRARDHAYSPDAAALRAPAVPVSVHRLGTGGLS